MAAGDTVKPVELVEPVEPVDGGEPVEPVAPGDPPEPAGGAAAGGTLPAAASTGAAGRVSWVPVRSVPSACMC